MNGLRKWSSTTARLGAHPTQTPGKSEVLRLAVRNWLSIYALRVTEPPDIVTRLAWMAAKLVSENRYSGKISEE